MVESPSVTGRIRAAHAALWANGRGWILTTVGLGWLLGLGVRLTFPALLPPVRAEFGMDLTSAGILLTGLWLAYAIGQLPGGVLGDRIGERNTLVVSTGIATGTVLIIVVSASQAWFVIGTVLFGLGTGLFATTRFTVIADVYPEHDGTAMGITASAGNVGAAILPVVAGFIAVAAGWRLGFGVTLPLFVLVVVGLWRVVPERTSGSDGAVETFSRAAGRRIIRGVRRRSTLLAAGSMLLLSVVYNGFTGFYPTYLVAEKGLSQSTAATLFGLFFGLGVVVQPITGAIGDRFGARQTMAVFVGISGLALAALPVVTGLPGLVIVTVVISLQLGYWPVAQAYVIESLPVEIQGSGFGLLRTLYLLVSSLGPAMVGALADAGYFDGAFLSLAGAAMVAVLLCGALPTLD